MYQGKMIFSQLLAFLPKREFRRIVQRYDGDRRVRSFSCWDQFLCLCFAQLTYRESLRDIEVCLRAMGKKLYHAGIRGKVSRNTLAKANERRDWRIYSDFAQILIVRARKLYADEPFDLELEQTVYALDSSTIDLCLSIFPWAKFSDSRASVKLHTLLDLRGSIPVFADITSAKRHDVNMLDTLILEPGAIYVMDRAYVHFARLYKLHQAATWFVVRAKKGLRYRRIYSHPIDKMANLRSDQTITLTGVKPSKEYPEKLRRVRCFDPENQQFLVFLTNNFTLPAATIAEIYRSRWKVELFFKWIKQHLRIKSFYGTSENAVKIQIWIALSSYLLIAIAKKELNIEKSLATLLQFFSLTLFEKTPILTALNDQNYTFSDIDSNNQLELLLS